MIDTRAYRWQRTYRPTCRPRPPRRVGLIAGLAAACLCGATEPVWAKVIDLAFAPPSHRVSGTKAEDRTGQSVLFGDVNGDGRDDLIIAAPEFDLVGRMACGAVYIVIANDTLPTVLNLDDVRPDVKRVFGAVAGSRLGAVMACGDVNDDGRGDIICGIPGASPLGRFSAGELYVVFGSDAPADTVDLAAPPAGVTRVLGAAVFDKTGTSVAVGDVNGDSYGDVVAGAPLATAVRSLTGKVDVIHGAATLPAVIDLAGAVDVTRIFGQATNDFFGGAVFAAELTGDGVADVVVGAPESSPFGRSQAGTAYIIPGSASLADTIDTIDASTLGITQIFGEAAHSATGSGFVAGDFDGDLTAELAVGAPEFAANHGGAVYLLDRSGPWPVTIDLAGTGALSRFDGNESNAHAGSRLAAGDLNLDGKDELVIGAPRAKASIGRDESGKVHIVFGRTVFPPLVSLTPPQNGVITIYGAAVQDHVGSAVACGRIGGTGRFDLLVGAEQLDNPGELRAGAGLLFLGTVDFTPTAILSYDATVTDGAVHLTWRLADVVDTDAIRIERSGDGQRIQFGGDRITRLHTRYDFVDRTAAPATTYKYAVIRLDGEAGVVLVIGVTVPPRDTARLDPAFPNPFATATSVPIWLPAAGVVDVTVYDVSGARVRVLENGHLPAGPSTLSWDGRDVGGAAVPSGVYFLRMRHGNTTLDRKLLLLR